MGDLARQGFELALKGLAVFKKSVLGVIHLFEEFADADEIVGDSAEVRVIGVVAGGHEDDPWVGRVGLASLAKRLVKLAPRFVLSGARPHRLDHVLHRARQRSHLSLRALTLKSRAFCGALSAGLAEAGLLRP